MRWRGSTVRPCTMVQMVLSRVDGFLRQYFRKITFFIIWISSALLIEAKSIHVWMRAQHFYTAKLFFFFLQIASMGFKTTLLIVLTTACATTGNCARVNKYLVYFHLPLAVDRQPRRCANDWAQTPIVACPAHMTAVTWMYICSKENIISLFSNVRVYTYTKLFLPHRHARRFDANCHDSKVG